MVTCKLCKAQFPSSLPDKYGDGTQGHGCATSVYRKDGWWYAHGYYGSRLFDMNLYRFVDGPGDPWQSNPTEKLDPVCDICISVWLRLEKLVLINEHVL